MEAGVKACLTRVEKKIEFDEEEERNIFNYFEDFFLLRGVGMNSSLSQTGNII